MQLISPISSNPFTSSLALLSFLLRVYLFCGCVFVAVVVAFLLLLLLLLFTILDDWFSLNGIRVVGWVENGEEGGGETSSPIAMPILLKSLFKLLLL